MGRKILAVILGLVVGSIVNSAFIAVSNAIYPLPDTVDQNDMEAFSAYVAENGLPVGALLIVLLAHSGGSLASGVVCGFVAKRAWIPGAIGLGVLWTCAGILMLFLIPAPIWFAIADIALYIPAAIVGVIIGGKIPPFPNRMIDTSES